MNKREQIREIVDSMCDYFEVDTFDDLDSGMKEDLLKEVNECLGISIPIEVLDHNLSRKEFIDACLEEYGDSI